MVLPASPTTRVNLAYHYKTAFAVQGEVRLFHISMRRSDNFQCFQGNRFDSELVKVTIFSRENGIREK